MNEWKSLLISAGGHAAILVLSIIISLFAHPRSFRQEPIRVDLLPPGPVGGTPEGGGDEKKTTPVVEKKEAPKTKTKEPPKVEKKEKKTIIDKPKEIVKPTMNVDARIADLEDWLKKNKMKPAGSEEKKQPETTTYSGTGRPGGKGGVYGGGGGSAYDSMLQQIIRNNWMQPGRAVVGEKPPVVLVTIVVDRNGNILSSKITQSSGIRQLDESALKAIEDSNPLPVFPSYLSGNQRNFELRFIVED